jgi:hypothetical protein
MIKRWGLYFCVSLSLCSCGLFNKSEYSGIKFDSSVTEEQKQQLISDLQVIGSLTFNGVTQGDLDKINLVSLSTDSLNQFLLDRVKYIVGEGYDSSTQKIIISNNFPYYPTKWASLDSFVDRVVTVMTNTGSAVYLSGKESNTLYSLKIGGDEVPINSPRAGVIKIGEGLFSNSRTKNFSSDSLAARLIRLSTLFHESRHSDGNGTNAAFPHAQCTSGDFSGYYACEANINGPYNLEAMLLKHFYRSCYGCSESELSALQVSAADAANRLQYGARFQDPQPEYVK